MPVYDYDNIINALKTAKKIWIVGDGGSAALADHFACDLLKNCELPAISLCSNSALITAIANDYGFEDTFQRQLKILFQPYEDLLIIFSTSGKSPNLINAAKKPDVIAVIGGNIDWWAKETMAYIFLIDGKDQMEIEDNMLVFCHEVTRRIMCQS